MKKIILSISIFLLALSAGVAQDAGVQFAFHIEPGVSWLSNNADNEAIEGDGSSFLFKVGANAEWFFRENYAVKFGLSMATGVGGSLRFNTIENNAMPVALFADSQPDIVTNVNSSSKFRYQYIELPVGLKLRTNELNDNMRYFVDAPILTFGFNVGARGEIDEVDAGDFRINDDTFLFQMSWGLGAGAEYAISDNTALTAGVYFQSGFINTYNGSTGDDAIDDTKTTPNMVSLRIGVLF